MTERAAALADAFDALHLQVVQAVSESSEQQWATSTAVEHWPAGFGFYHLADGYVLIREWIEQAAAGGEPIVLDPAANDARNAQSLAAHRECTKAEVLALLNERARLLTALVRGLTDEQLTRGALVVPDGSTRDVEAVASGPMLSHVRNHLASIKAATGLD